MAPQSAWPQSGAAKIVQATRQVLLKPPGPNHAARGMRQCCRRPQLRTSLRQNQPFLGNDPRPGAFA